MRLTLFYGSECWAVKKSDIQKNYVIEMRILRWMLKFLRKMKKNIFIREQLGIALIEDKVRENHF